LISFNTLIFNLDPPIDDYQQQILRKTTLPLYSDDYDNVPNVPLSILSTPINHKQIPTTNVNLSLNLPSTNSSSSTTPVPSPESHVPSQIERRRSISPPLPPQMSPDNGRPLNHLTQITSQRPIAENIDLLERSKPTSRAQVINNRNVSIKFFVKYRILLLIHHHNNKHESKYILFWF
jgi:hypothetical protein